MKARLLAGAALLCLLSPPAHAAVTTNALQTLVGSISTTGVPYAQRIQYAMVLTAQNVGGEPVSTARHTERARFAAQVLQNPTQYVPAFAQDVAVQLPLATTNMVTVAGVPNADVDSTDAFLQTTCANIWNLLLPQ